jgi:hypothetical protein
MEGEKAELLPRSFILLREIWEEAKKKARAAPPAPAQSGARTHVLAKKRNKHHDKKGI